MHQSHSSPSSAVICGESQHHAAVDIENTTNRANDVVPEAAIDDTEEESIEISAPFSIDTTQRQSAHALPFFSLTRYLRGPNPDSDKRSEESPAAMMDPSVGSTTTDEHDDNNSHSRPRVPSLSSLEGDIETAVGPIVPLTFEEFDNESYHPTIHKDHSQDSDETELEGASHGSSSALSFDDDPPNPRGSSGAMTTHAALDRSDILFPKPSLARDGRHGCKSYCFSVLVGLVALTSLLVFLMIVQATRTSGDQQQ